MNKHTLSNEQKAYAIHQFIIENYNMKITRKLLCKTFFVNRKFFSEHFVPLYNQSFKEVQTEQRMQVAIIQLQTAKHIKEIARDLGFSSSSTFDHTFKKKYHISPVAYRKKNSAI